MPKRFSDWKWAHGTFFKDVGDLSLTVKWNPNKGKRYQVSIQHKGRLVFAGGAADLPSAMAVADDAAEARGRMTVSSGRGAPCG